jgi:hypothetical protein
MSDAAPDNEAVLYRFNKLIQELLRGSINRNCFRPWEIELLLDIDNCNLRESGRRETLRRYQRAVQGQIENGATRPQKLSEYLQGRRSARRSHSAQSDLPQLAGGNPNPAI